jgi:hypothetical protein
LATLERAVAAHSCQVRADWGTPCVQLAPGGWQVYMKIGGAEAHGEHDLYGQPKAPSLLMALTHSVTIPCCND